jgi:hypothetical protein
VGLERIKHWTSVSDLGDRGLFYYLAVVFPSMYVRFRSVKIINSRFLGQLAISYRQSYSLITNTQYVVVEIDVNCLNWK